MATQAQVRVSQEQDAIQIHIGGELAKRIDIRMVEGCVNTAVACIEQNHLRGEPFAFNEKCLTSLVGHGMEAQCISQGFGLSSSVRVTRGQENIQIHIGGELAKRVDVRMLEGCVNAAAACIEQSHPLGRQFSFDSKCLTTLMAHNEQTQCISRGFGLVPIERA